MTDSHEVERLSELAPCPRCGHAPDWSRDSSSASIYCPNEDGCSGMDVTIDAADGDAADPWPRAVERWNHHALLNDINRKTTPEGEMSDHFTTSIVSAPDAASVERLAILAEEAGEIVQVIGKILRHGWDNRPPVHLKAKLWRPKYMTPMASGMFRC